jgi:type II secretory pathway pseudopilin PulG
MTRAALLRVSILASALSFCTAGIAQAASGDIESAYRQLVQTLQQSRNGSIDITTRAQITQAAKAFQDAMQRDGGARPDLAADAHNIIASLSDSTFNAGASVNALRRDAKGSVIEFGKWNPSLPGSPIANPIGTHLNQSSEGDCVGISVVKAFSNTQTGAAILRRAVALNTDGSYNVSLPGDPSTIYRLNPGELDQFGKGDPGAAAVVGAMFQYFRKDPKQGALPTNKVMELLAGHAGEHDRLADIHSTPAQITAYLLEHADGAGSRYAMVFGGKPARNGDWSKGDGHAFAIIRIDKTNMMLTYTNPWNEATTRTIAIQDLAQQAAGTSADFETVTFR